MAQYANKSGRSGIVSYDITYSKDYNAMRGTGSKTVQVEFITGHSHNYSDPTVIELLEEGLGANTFINKNRPS